MSMNYAQVAVLTASVLAMVCVAAGAPLDAWTSLTTTSLTPLALHALFNKS